MITIEIDITTILVTVIASIISIALSGVITWYFSKRHYTRSSQPVTENDIKLQSQRYEFYVAVLFIVLFLGGFLGFLITLAALS